MTHTQISEYILSMPGSNLEYPFGPEVEVYKANDKLFALIEVDSSPVQLSLKCDPQLAKVLRDKYETVMPGKKLSKNHWNTILCSGQLEWTDIQDLIRHAYELVRVTDEEPSA